MRVEILFSKEDLDITFKGNISKDEELWIRNILDHAVLKKGDVTYDQNNNLLRIKLMRHEKQSKARKKFFGLVIWNTCILPTKPCILTIKDIESCEIRDEDLKTLQYQEVIIGGIAFEDNEIYIGSFCERDNAYGITLKVQRINIILKDMNS